MYLLYTRALNVDYYSIFDFRSNICNVFINRVIVLLVVKLDIGKCTRVPSYSGYIHIYRLCKNDVTHR